MAARVLTAGLLLSLGASAARGQDAAGGSPRLRIEASSLSERIQGQLTAVDGETMTLEVPGGKGPVMLRRSDVRKIEVSRGRKRWRTRYILLGAAVGLVAGGALAYHYIDAEPPFAERKAATALAVGPAAGALLGGALFTSEVWETTPWPGRAASSERRPGFSLQVRVRF